MESTLRWLHSWATIFLYLFVIILITATIYQHREICILKRRIRDIPTREEMTKHAKYINLRFYQLECLGRDAESTADAAYDMIYPWVKGWERNQRKKNATKQD